MDDRPRAVCWLRPDQAMLARAVRDLAGLDIVGVGSPDAAQRSQAATELETQALDDLRATIASTDASLVLILDPGRFGQSDEDRSALLEARARGVLVASLEPVPAAALELASGWTQSTNGVRPIECVRTLPLARHAPAVLAAQEVREPFGTPRTLAIESLCTPAQGSLGARLFDAMELIDALVGEPELVDASYAGPKAAGGLRALPGDTLRELRGDLTAHLRFADGRSAVVIASSRASGWERRVTMLGEGGRLRITERGFVWQGPDGVTVDTHRNEPVETDETDPGPNQAPGPNQDPGTAAIAAALRAMLDPASPARAPVDHAAALAIAHAALLSARTGQSESPATIRRLIRTD